MKKHLRTSAAAFSILALAAVGCETDADTETGTTEEPLPEAPATEEPLPEEPATEEPAS